MRKYYAEYDSNENLIGIGMVETDGPVFGEISKEEYETLKATILPPETIDPIDEALAILSGEVTDDE